MDTPPGSPGSSSESLDRSPERYQVDNAVSDDSPPSSGSDPLDDSNAEDDETNVDRGSSPFPQDKKGSIPQKESPCKSSDQKAKIEGKPTSPAHTENKKGSIPQPESQHHKSSDQEAKIEGKPTSPAHAEDNSSGSDDSSQSSGSEMDCVNDNEDEDRSLSPDYPEVQPAKISEHRQDFPDRMMDTRTKELFYSDLPNIPMFMDPSSTINEMDNQGSSDDSTEPYLSPPSNKLDLHIQDEDLIVESTDSSPVLSDDYPLELLQCSVEGFDHEEVIDHSTTTSSENNDVDMYLFKPPEPKDPPPSSPVSLDYKGRIREFEGRKDGFVASTSKRVDVKHAPRLNGIVALSDSSPASPEIQQAVIITSCSKDNQASLRTELKKGRRNNKNNNSQMSDLLTLVDPRSRSSDSEIQRAVITSSRSKDHQASLKSELKKARRNNNCNSLMPELQTVVDPRSRSFDTEDSLCRLYRCGVEADLSGAFIYHEDEDLDPDRPLISMEEALGFPSPTRAHEFDFVNISPVEWKSRTEPYFKPKGIVSRKRPYEDYDLRPGKWIGVKIDGREIPGLLVKLIGSDIVQVSILKPRKTDEIEEDEDEEDYKNRPTIQSNHHLIECYGWKVYLPQVTGNVRPRNRSELLRLLNELTTCLKLFDYRKYDDINLKCIRRLVCKLRYLLSPNKSKGYHPTCSCRVLSESCSGLVRGPPILLENIRCDYTERLLPPVIFQTFEIKPPWLSMHEEMRKKVISKKKSTIGCIKFIKRPLTFAHITSHHLPAIKCLLGSYFWSNVDVSTVLQYPEFTCVVLYGHLVVGFGYLSPGTHQNEGYINFLFVRPHWRRCGIGETILYLLRQQCLFWTLTLHVSPNSEALNLYHKFGFKIYCRIKNFYVGYVISNSQAEKDALFMKLESRIPEMF